MGLFNKTLVTMMPFVPKPIVGFFAKKYVAGICLENALDLVGKLNEQGISATLDVLGESVKTKEEAGLAVEEYKNALVSIEKLKLDSNISIKPTHLGLNLDYDFCFQNIKELVAEADHRGNFVRIDMEDSPHTDNTLKILAELKKEFNNVGVALQAYLRRSLDDVEKTLIPLKSDVRLCKGIYDEKHEIAYKDYEIIRKNYAYLLLKLLSGGCYVGIATHDEMLVWEGIRVIDKLGLREDQYEFQMLLGVTPLLRDIILKSGHKIRVYVPFGREWHSYCIRRMKENPQVAGHVFKALFTRK